MHKVPEARRCSPPEFQAGAATYGCTVAQELAHEVARLQAQVRLQRQRGDRYRDRRDEIAQELSAQRVKVWRIATTKWWTNEDGERFMFMSDIQAALGLPVESSVSEPDRTVLPAAITEGPGL